MRSTMTVRNAIAAAILALALGAMAACSGPAAPPPVQPSRAPGVPPQARTAGTDARACAIAPSAMVAAALKLPVGRVMGTVEGPVTVCAYTGRYEVLVRFQHDESASEFAAARQSTGARHQLVTAVTGLGHGAYLATYTLAKPPQNTLAVRHGRFAIFITSPAALAAERKLMRRLLART